MLRSPHRALLPALTVSLLLHAVLLSSAFTLLPTRVDVPAGAINALIMAARRGDAPPAVGAPAARPPSPPAKPPAPGLHSVTAPRSAVSEPAFAEVVTAPDKALPHDSGVPSTATPAARAAPAIVVATPSAAAAGAGREGVSADDVRQYRLSLASAAGRFKRYPALASQRGWEGTVEAALNFSALSPMPEVVLVRSSGRRVLDEQALAMLTQAAQVTALPEGLRSRNFRVLLPVQFSLDNDDQ